MGTVAVLNGKTMEVDTDGSYTITVDSEPAGGRPNHVQTTPEAHEFYVRDVLLDWACDDPNHITVERLGAAPATPARTLDEQAEATAAMMAYSSRTSPASSVTASTRCRPTTSTWPGRRTKWVP